MIYHGIAIAKENIGENIKKHESGIITAYLPEMERFAVLFSDNRFHTYCYNEEWFLDNFEVIKSQPEINGNEEL